jgi:hypothetical protein
LQRSGSRPQPRRRTAARKKKASDALEDLKALAEPATGGDPMTEDKFVRRSLRTLSNEMDALGHAVCPTTVAEMLRDLGYNLRVNVKRLTGPYHPDRDRQFRYLEGLIEDFRTMGLPILSVDTKKKELVGNFCNGGQAWVEEPYEVNAHDFPSDAWCQAVPYGLYESWRTRGTSWWGRRRTRPRSQWMPWPAGGCVAAASVTGGLGSC